MLERGELRREDESEEREKVNEERMKVGVVWRGGE